MARNSQGPYVFVRTNQKVTFEITKTATQHWKSICSVMFFNAIFSGIILPIRTGPQFAFFTDDFNDDDEALKRPHTFTPQVVRGAGDVWGPGCPALAEVPGECWPLIGQYSQYLTLIGQLLSDLQPGL